MEIHLVYTHQEEEPKQLLKMLDALLLKQLKHHLMKFFLQGVELKQIIWLFGQLFMVRKNIL